MNFLARLAEPLFVPLEDGGYAFRPWGGWGARFRVDEAEKQALARLVVHHVELAALFVAVRLIVDLIAGAFVADLFAGRPAPADLLLAASLAGLAALYAVRLRRQTAALERLPEAETASEESAMPDGQLFGYAALGALVIAGALALALMGWVAGEAETLVLGLGAVVLFAWIASPYARAALARLRRRNRSG